MKILPPLIALCFLLANSYAASAVNTDKNQQLGKVDFAISCDKSAQQTFNQAIALVHHMMYLQAEGKFNQIIKEHPNCAMAYWGVALTQIHPLWGGKPTDAQMIKGATTLKKAAAFPALTKREKAYITALNPLYTDWKDIPYKQRIQKWEQAQQNLFKAFPKDPDALAFYALAHLAVAPKEDREFKNQEKAGKLLEAMNKQHPTHPAGYHYTIHAYDNPKLAAKGEKYAHGYDKIAPEVPHALHMPSHIFVRLGHWPETINWNIRSAKAAINQKLPDGVMSMHYAHALDYLMYAYLQQGEFDKAKKVLEKANSVKKYQDSFPTAYGIAATRARFYLEQHLWQQAANISLDKPKSFPWSKYPAAESILYFARGLGAINTGDDVATQQSIEKLGELEKALIENKQTYWAILTKAKQLSLKAMLAFTQGDKTQALKIMQKAADLEDSVDKHPVTPGEVMPARELLANMLLKLDKPKQAVTAYQAVLKISPNRRNAIIGEQRAEKKYLAESQQAKN